MLALRSNFASALAAEGQSFWLMQQDTFWRESLFDLNFDQPTSANVTADDTKQDAVNFESFDILFDQIGATPASARAQWINGGGSVFLLKWNYTIQYVEIVIFSLPVLEIVILVLSNY